MVSRLSAIVLVALIVLPFAAPFATCDVSSLLATDDDAEQSSSGPQSLAQSPDDVWTADALPVARVVGRARCDALTASTPVDLFSAPARRRATRNAGAGAFVLKPLVLPLRI